MWKTNFHGLGWRGVQDDSSALHSSSPPAVWLSSQQAWTSTCCSPEVGDPCFRSQTVTNLFSLGPCKQPHGFLLNGIEHYYFSLKILFTILPRNEVVFGSGAWLFKAVRRGSRPLLSRRTNPSASHPLLHLWHKSTHRSGMGLD